MGRKQIISLFIVLMTLYLVLGMLRTDKARMKSEEKCIEDWISIILVIECLQPKFRFQLLKLETRFSVEA